MDEQGNPPRSDDLSPLVPAMPGKQAPSAVSRRQWAVFFTLLLATAATTYLAGGILFAVSLLSILGAHEFGHYWAGTRNGVGATLPYFIPAPPFFITGTFGAFIRIKTPIPDRRVLMEIGAAGPIAGFIVAVPALLIGLSLSTVTPAQTGVSGISYGTSLLLNFCARLILGVDPESPLINIQLHPIAFAGWIGLLITSLNLLPIGQLDGGHIIYSMLRERYYHYFTRLFLAALLPFGFYWHGWWFWAAAIVMFGLKHGPVIDESVALTTVHRWLGGTAILILCATFIPVPFAVMY